MGTPRRQVAAPSARREAMMATWPSSAGRPSPARRRRLGPKDLLLLPSRMGGVRSGWGRSTFSYTRDHDGGMAPPGVPVRRRHLGPKDLLLLPSRVGDVS